MNLGKDIRRILDVGIALTSEKDYYQLLEKIIKESMEITGCDAGTFYTMDSVGLKFMIMRNKTLQICQGGRGEKIHLARLPLREDNVCTYSAMNRKPVNIADAYQSSEFNFNGQKNYDRITGYRTQSMLVIPLVNHFNESLGVIQLINAMNEQGEIIPFDPQYEYVIHSLASQAAITLDNMNHFNEMKELLNSMVLAFTTAIDERTPYNANHTKNVAKYTEELIDFINREYSLGNTELYYSKERKEQLIMAAMLHDIGKLVTPIEVMNKSTRLGDGMAAILNRFELLRLYWKVEYLEGRITKEVWERERKYLNETVDFIRKVDTAPCIDAAITERIEELGSKVYTNENGEKIYYITEHEKECMTITKGTLTARERVIMEEHVVITNKLLEQIHFSKEYSNVPTLAGVHHEFLDGSGYPLHLPAEKIPQDARVLTILDIYDSLISTDRPYKKPMPKDRAIMILEEMTGEGKLDGVLVDQLKRLVAAKSSH